MKITLQTSAATDARHRRLKVALEASSLADVYRRALVVYEAVHDAESVTVTKNGETKTLVLP